MASLAAGQVFCRPLPGSNITASRRRESRTSLQLRRLQVVRAVADTEKSEAAEPAAPAPEPVTTLTEKGNIYDNPYTGMKTDAAGVTVIDVIEPKAYVGDAASSSTGLAVGGTLAALAGAGAVLFFLGGNQPTPEALTLSQYAQKFESEIVASTPVAVLEAEEIVVVEAEAPALEVLEAPAPEVAAATEQAFEAVAAPSEESSPVDVGDVAELAAPEAPVDVGEAVDVVYVAVPE